MTISSSDEAKRLHDVYTNWEDRRARWDLYSPFNTANLFTRQQRQRAELALLLRHGFAPLHPFDVLEIGCGSGEILLNFMTYGADPARLHGIDVQFDRVRDAHRRLPHVTALCADGQRLPYRAEAFDLILQYTAFSSILDDTIKYNLAREIVRLLRPNGLILWYDFWLNPKNPQTRGIRLPEINCLFPGFTVDSHRITLAPPLARRLVPHSWMLCFGLEKLKIFNTHYLVALRRE